MQRVLTALFNRTGKAAAAAVARDSTGGAAAIAKRAFSAAALRTALKAAIRPTLTAIARAGASRELQQHKPRRTAEIRLILRTPAVLSKQTRIPPEVKESLDGFLDGLLERPYWDDVADNVREDIVKAIQAGLDAGESGDEIAGRVAAVMGPAANGVRARRIARTETTGALNAGAEAARAPLYEAGLIAAKEWLAIEDKDTRPEHEDADGQQAGPGEPFEVGGEKCAYPGDPDLSAGMRVNCRCTSVSVSADVEDAEAEKALRWFSGWAV